MDITPLIRQDAQVIQSYGGGGFKVSGQSFNGAVLISATQTIQWPVSAQTVGQLSETDFDFIKQNAGAGELLLLGTGSKMEFIKPHIRTMFEQAGLAIETMDTGAACRTYNVLLAEGREVIVALLPIV